MSYTLKISLIAALFCISAYSSQALADAYGYADDSGAIYLTDTPTGDQFELVQAAPVEARLVVTNEAVNSALDGLSRIKQANSPFNEAVKSASKESGVEEKLLHAVITAESNYNPRAVSPKGAMGLMQLMPATARQYGVANAFNPNQNIQGGARYLAYLKTLFHDDLALTVAAYNAGENAVIKHGGKVPPFRETTAYVSKVLSLYKRYD